MSPFAKTYVPAWFHGTENFLPNSADLALLRKSWGCDVSIRAHCFDGNTTYEIWRLHFVEYKTYEEGIAAIEGLSRSRRWTLVVMTAVDRGPYG